MKRVLLVDDDPLILLVYKRALGGHGLQVSIAKDGLEAMKSLRASKPDVLVLDLMMPRFSGVEVLRFIRSEPGLKDLPVVVLSNAYMDDLAEKAAAAGAQKALLKVTCNPGLLMDAINEVLGGQAGAVEPSQLVAVPQPESAEPPSPRQSLPLTVNPTPTGPKAKPPAPVSAAQDHARRDFLAEGGSMCGALLALFEDFSSTRDPQEREVRLQSLYRKVHFLTASAAVAECQAIGQMAGVLEALLFQLMGEPSRITPSVVRTIGSAVTFFQRLFEHSAREPLTSPGPLQALVIDDDAISNRLVVSALKQAKIQASSIQDPELGWEFLRKKQFDLVLLDIEMPGLRGYQLCRRLRTLPGYAKTPVIFVTIHSDFENRSEAMASGGDDLIAKPVLPLELAVKAVTYLLQSRLPV